MATLAAVLGEDTAQDLARKYLAHHELEGDVIIHCYHHTAAY